MTDKPRPSPRPPDDSAPFALDKTPTHFPVTAEYVKRKLAESGQGRPRIPPRLTPWFLIGFTVCTAVTGVVIGDPSWPVWLVKSAGMGTAVFGALLALGTGWRK